MPKYQTPAAVARICRRDKRLSVDRSNPPRHYKQLEAAQRNVDYLNCRPDGQ